MSNAKESGSVQSFPVLFQGNEVFEYIEGNERNHSVIFVEEFKHLNKNCFCIGVIGGSGTTTTKASTVNSSRFKERRY